MRKPPSKETLLALSEYYFETGHPSLGWDYLVCWGFYEMFVEGWWQE